MFHPDLAQFAALLALRQLERLNSYVIQTDACGMRAQATSKAEIEKTIREYEHPEILLEMSQTLQKRQAASKQNEAQSKLATGGCARQSGRDRLLDDLVSNPVEA